MSSDKTPRPPLRCEQEVYVVYLTKGCGSGRLIKLTEPIDIDSRKIVTDTLSTNIRDVIREELEIE